MEFVLFSLDRHFELWVVGSISIFGMNYYMTMQKGQVLLFSSFSLIKNSIQFTWVDRLSRGWPLCVIEYCEINITPLKTITLLLYSITVKMVKLVLVN